MAARRPVPCPHRCRKPVPSTVFVRFHPLRLDAEVRVCPECGRRAVFPTGQTFRDDWGQSLYVPVRAPEGP